MHRVVPLLAAVLGVSSVSACTLAPEETPIAGRPVINPGSPEENWLDYAYGWVWQCPDGQRVRYLADTFRTHTCAPDRPQI